MAAKKQPKALERATFYIEGHQLKALRAEATKRMLQRASGRPDASEVLREVLDTWLAKR